MNADLDSRIRELVGRAVADAPPAPALPLRTEQKASVIPMSSPQSRRAWMVAGAALAAAAALVVAVILLKDDDPGGITADTGTPTTAEAETTVSPAPAWPNDVAVIVASDRGVEKVTAENGKPVVTRDGDVPAELAFEWSGGVITDTQHRQDTEDVLNDVRPDGSVLAFGPGEEISGCSASAIGNVCRVGTGWVADGDIATGAAFAAAQLAAISPTGETLAWLTGSSLQVARLVGDGGVRQIPVPAGTWTALDITDVAAVLSGDGVAPS